MSRKSLETRARILRTTWKLLEAGPDGAVRMSDIAKAAGISRQALYLHFPTRAELLVATTHFIDEEKDVDARLRASRAAATGAERLSAFIEAWGNYIPEVYGVLKALMAMEDADEDARAALQDRMQAVREGCKAAVAAIRKDGLLRPEYSAKAATDLLWVLLSPRNWALLTIECGWSQSAYLDHLKRAARDMLIAPGGG